MKIVSVAAYATPTYDYFRREVGRFIAQTKVKNLSEAQLRAVVDAAVERWRAEQFPKNWILLARAEALREIRGTSLDARLAPRRSGANGLAARE
jgi:hypothetical protein